MVEVNFYDEVSDELLEFAVIIAKTNGKWVFCKHKVLSGKLNDASSVRLFHADFSS